MNVHKTLVSLSAQVNDLSRRLDNMITPGKVSAVSDDGKQIKVKHGSCETPFIKWFCLYCGDVTDYRAPSVNESVLLLNIGGGDDTSLCYALVGLPSDDFDLGDVNIDEHIRKYPDGTIIKYNHKQKSLTADLVGTATINTEGKTTVNCDDHVEVTAKSNATVTAEKVLLNSDGNARDESVVVRTPCPFSGSDHISCQNTVFTGKG